MQMEGASAKIRPHVSSHRVPTRRFNPSRKEFAPMPIYAYKCATCGHAEDIMQKMSDDPRTTCPSCGAETFSKQVTAPNFALKGSGWYVTDFRDNKKPDATKSAEGSAADGAKDGSKDGSKADAKPDTSAADNKSESKPTTTTPAAAPTPPAPAAPAAAASPSSTPST